MPILTLRCNTYMLDLSFSTYYDVAKLQIVYVENKYNPIASATYRMFLISHFCSGVAQVTGYV